ncbi:MAG: prephenate dehydrogenase [Fimbriiglobus sp.]
MRFGQVTIIGVGLIGGSVGLALERAKLADCIVGVGRDERTLERAMTLGAIHTYTTNLAEAVREADFIVVCTPVDRVAADVVAVAHAAPPRAVITDVGSTKGNILTAIEGKMPAHGAMFIGSHPLAGSEKRGASHSKAELFDDRLVIVTPTLDSDIEAVSVVELFWQQLGARIVRMDAHEHDKALAFTSHMPHAVAAGVAGATPPGWLMLTAGGFRDTTRIAGGDPALWAAIFAANRSAVLTATDEFLIQMAAFRTALADEDQAALTQWLTAAKQVRDALGS